MSFYQRTWGRLWPGSAHVTPPCVILRPLLLVFVCVRKATFSGVLDERMMSCLQISALTTVSVCLFGSRETELFQQSSPVFSSLPFQSLNERGNLCFHGMKAFRHPRWVRHRRRMNRVYSFRVEERLKIMHGRVVKVTFCTLLLPRSTLSVRSKLRADGWRCSPRISVILPFPSWNAASFFRYTLHHGSCHRACCRPTHTCWDWPHGLFFSSSQGNTTGHLVHSNWIKVKFDRAYLEKQFGFPQGDIGGGPVGCICCGSAMTTLKKEEMMKADIRFSFSVK